MVTKISCILVYRVDKKKEFDTIKDNQDNFRIGLIFGPIVGILISIVFHLSLFLCLLFCIVGGIMLDFFFDT